VRTNARELKALARVQAERVNPGRGAMEWFIPMKGFCSYSIPGGPLHDPGADRAYVETLKQELRKDIPVHIRDLDINDPAFATEAAEHLIDLVNKEQRGQR
jgi:uncharacterized protein (UPF0261 family)